ncbi:hypothetical protein [Helicobacter sp.]|uniref:hypothetical protein n=1 Tax=Helicobacter sp. TaxID=218 RepID=UPI00388E1DA5
MNTRIQSMLWIWIIWSVLCAGVSVVMFGLNHYAKSHTWRADFTYLASAQNSPPPPHIGRLCHHEQSSLAVLL